MNFKTANEKIARFFIAKIDDFTKVFLYAMATQGAMAFRQSKHGSTPTLVICFQPIRIHPYVHVIGRVL